MSMSYSTTTVSRRKFMVKVKNPGQSPSAPSRLDGAGSSSKASAGKASTPESFLRTPYRRPLRVASSPWWTNWLAVTLVNVTVVAAIGGLYAWVGTDSEESGYVPRRTMVRTPSPINSAAPIKSAAAATTFPAPQSSTLSTARQAVASPSAADEIDRAMQDGSRKLVLPSNVAGNCSIGDGGSKDLGRCLAQNGARVK